MAAPPKPDKPPKPMPDDPPADPAPTPVPAPAPVPDDDPPLGIFRRWLSVEEFGRYSPDERVALRRERRRAHNLAKWPEHGGRRPWLAKLEAAAIELPARLVLVLAEAARRAVHVAAAAVLSGAPISTGEARHKIAVAALMAAVAGVVELSKAYAGELIVSTFDLVAAEG